MRADGPGLPPLSKYKFNSDAWHTALAPNRNAVYTKVFTMQKAVETMMRVAVDVFGNADFLFLQATAERLDASAHPPNLTRIANAGAAELAPLVALCRTPGLVGGAYAERAALVRRAEAEAERQRNAAVAAAEAEIKLREHSFISAAVAYARSSTPAASAAAAAEARALDRRERAKELERMRASSGAGAVADAAPEDAAVVGVAEDVAAAAADEGAAAAGEADASTAAEAGDFSMDSDSAAAGTAAASSHGEQRHIMATSAFAWTPDEIAAVREGYELFAAASPHWCAETLALPRLAARLRSRSSNDVSSCMQRLRAADARAAAAATVFVPPPAAIASAVASAIAALPAAYVAARRAQAARYPEGISIEAEAAMMIAAELRSPDGVLAFGQHYAPASIDWAALKANASFAPFFTSGPSNRALRDRLGDLKAGRAGVRAWQAVGSRAGGSGAGGV
jgi:hypothetical protein